MGYGLRVKEANGTVILDTTDILGRVRYSTVVASGDTDNVTLSDISGKTTYAFAIPLEGNKLAHSVGISGTTFSWTAQSFGTSGPLSMPSCDTLVGVVVTD